MSNEWTEIVEGPEDADQILSSTSEDPDQILGGAAAAESASEEDVDQILGGVEEEGTDDTIYGATTHDEVGADMHFDAVMGAEGAFGGVRDTPEDPEQPTTDYDDDHDGMYGEGKAGEQAKVATDMVGEEIFDGQLEILGELMQESPAFRQYAERIFAESRPMFERSFPMRRARDWQIDFGPVSAPAGFVLSITKRPQCRFRVEKIIATDTATPAGTGTRIMSVFVGQKAQRPAAGRNSSLTAFFAPNALGNGVKWDTCREALALVVTVSFVQAVTFDMSCFGRAVL